MTLDELHKWVEDTKLHLCHWFTVDDLMYLKRGGRISAATALCGHHAEGQACASRGQ